MLSVSDLAEVIKNAIGATDRDGNPISVTPEMTTYAQAIITTLQSGIVSHLPGLVTADTVAGAPITNGAATGGLIAGLLPATWLGVMTSGFPTANPTSLSTESSASTGYLTSASLVEFASGNITGASSATAVSPGPLALGAGTGGEITGITGSPWASAVIPPTGDPVFTQNLYNAIANYIKDNTEIEYITGSVLGACPAVSGPLTGGSGIGGIVV